MTLFHGSTIDIPRIDLSMFAPSGLLTNRQRHERISGRIPEHEGGDCEGSHRPSDGRTRPYDAAGFRSRLYLAPLPEAQQPQDWPLFPKLRLCV